MMRVSRACALLASLTLAAALSGISWAGKPATDWPEFRFDDNHTANNPAETTFTADNVKFIQLAWRAHLGDAPSRFSEPTVVGKVVYITSSDGVLWAYPANGCNHKLDCTTPLWRSIALNQMLGAAPVANGLIYVTSQKSQTSNNGMLNAFAASGCAQSPCAPLWQGRLGTETAEGSATVANGMVYITTFAGELFVFNAEGCGKSICKPRWSAKIGKHSESTPLVSNGVVYVGAESEYFKPKQPVKGYLYAFKADGCGQKTCKPLWTGHTAAGVFNAAPVLQNGTVYIVAQDALYAFDGAGCGASDCAPLWRGIDTHAEGDIPYFNGSPAIGYGYVYVNEAEGFDIFPADGCGQSECDTVGHLFGDGLQGPSASPTLANGLVFAANDQGYLHVWNAKPCGDVDCFSLIQYPYGDFVGIPTSAAIVNGTIYFGAEDEQQTPSGRIFALKLRQ